MKKFTFLIIILFISCNIKAQYNLIIKLSPNSDPEEAYVTVSNKLHQAVINNKLLLRDRPISATVTNRGPFFITYLSHAGATIDKPWTNGLGEINIPKGTNSVTYEICVDDKLRSKCPKHTITTDPEWPGVSLTGMPTIRNSTIVE